MLSPKAVGASCAEIVTVAVAIACRNGRKRFQSVTRNPDSVLLDGIASEKAAQDSGIRLVVVVVVFGQIAQKLLGRAVALQISSCLLDRLETAFSAGSAGCHRQDIDPAQMLFLLGCLDVLFHCVLHGFIWNIEIHPFDGIGGYRENHQGKQTKKYSKTLHTFTSGFRV